MLAERSGELVVRLAGGVAELTLNRPDARNALTPALRDELAAVLRECRADPAVRAVLLAGEGTAFCAGMDLSTSTVATAGRPGHDAAALAEALRVGVQAIVTELWEMGTPAVAAVDGPAVGPGAHLALACDVVVVSPRARFLWPFSRLGLVVDAGGAYLLPRLVGLPRAKALVLLGDPLTGEDAVRGGLAYRCVEDPLAEARELAGRLAAGPTRALGWSKQLLNASFETALAASLDREGLAAALATTTTDVVEGLAAARTQRTPRFTGR